MTTATPTAREALEAFYQRHCRKQTAMAPHLPRLRALADGLELAVEFGVKHGSSSSALLMGARRVVSYDVRETPEARMLAAIVGDRWDYRLQDSRVAEPLNCALLFIDSLHTYAQLQAELARHAADVRRYLIFHDSLTFGSVGARGETGEALWSYEKGQSVPRDALGIRLAIDELMIADPTWGIAAHSPDSHGLLVLERRR